MKELIFNLENIGVCYRKSATLPWKPRKFWALHDVSFRVFRGETLGIIGQNGAGKSTLLKVLAGIIRPDKGILTRASIKSAMQSLGAGFEPRLTGRQNIVLNGLLLGMGKRYIFERMNDIIELADIGEFIEEPVKCYSSGMRARLGFAIAYYIETEVLLIDEALAAGDQAFQVKASKLIKEKIRNNHTVVLVTHSIQTLRELCDRVVQIENGHSLQELPLEETITRYLNSRIKVHSWDNKGLKIG